MTLDLNAVRSVWRSSQMPPSFELKQPSPQLAERLPADYVGMISELGGHEGFLGREYVRLYRLNELAALNSAYEATERMPEIILFASNGRGEGFAFVDGGAIVRVPFIPLIREAAIRIAPSFSAFLDQLVKSGPSPASNPSMLGKEVHDKHPICLGGSPTDPSNKMLVSPTQHAELCQYWNKVYRDAVSRG